MNHCLTALHIGNFKAFADTQRIPLKPITLIFGPNSAGKSSFIHSLALAHEAQFGRDKRSLARLDVHHTDIGGSSIDLGGFRQYVHRGQANRRVEWGAELAVANLGGRLAQLLGGLDGAIEEFEKGLGERWKNTAIAVVTEFGRTAQINGTDGTDHGTGTVAFLAGGAIKGGRMIADWPGLKTAQLYEGRDLKPTTDLRAVLKGLLQDHLGIGNLR